MGADGHIHIWNENKILEAFPEWDINDIIELFRCLPTHYCDELDGVRYHHCYYGDNMYVHYADPQDWYLPHDWEKDRTNEQEVRRRAIRERLDKFVRWLEENATHWEVWT